MRVRQPQFADDRWYPSSRASLDRALDRLVETETTPRRALGMVSPHAGWFYSGKVAGAAYASVVIPRRVILIGPNHRGIGVRRAVTTGAWRIPGRDVPIDDAAVRDLVARSGDIRDDPSAHAMEHSLEVQVPFLVRRNPEVTLVPLCLGRQSLEECRRLGKHVAATVTSQPGETIIVASSDMNHFENAAVGNRKDRLAIDRMLALDPKGLHETVARHDISMCGVIPATIMLYAALELGATSAELVMYQDSGDASGDKSSVVGYAGVTVH